MGRLVHVSTQQCEWPRGHSLVQRVNVWRSQYWPEVVEAQNLIRAGAIGELCSVRAKYWESAAPELNEWAADGSCASYAATCVQCAASCPAELDYETHMRARLDLVL
eukprot:SAG11_NODE_6585_length_1283_cov_1.198480_2_plen_107_part_00